VLEGISPRLVELQLARLNLDGSLGREHLLADMCAHVIPLAQVYLLPTWEANIYH